MYHYVEDREFISRIRGEADEIMRALCRNLREDYGIHARFFLVGSAKRRLITQNENQPVDLDYNLEIRRCEDFDNCRLLKELAMASLNKALRPHVPYWQCCQDSTSALTARKRSCLYTYQADYSIDVCIVMRDRDGRYHRLIHEKTGWVCLDRFYWNAAPQSRELQKKEEYIRQHGKWALVRDQYLRLKNLYLTRNDHNHPSFICYTEAISNVYNTRGHW